MKKVVDKIRKFGQDHSRGIAGFFIILDLYISFIVMVYFLKHGWIY